MMVATRVSGGVLSLASRVLGRHTAGALSFMGELAGALNFWCDNSTSMFNPVPMFNSIPMF